MEIIRKVFPYYLLHYMVIVPTAIVGHLFTFNKSLSPETWSYTSSWFLNLWTRYDSGWYYNIVKNGYTEESVAFFPLYPYTIKFINYITGIHSVIIGLVLSNLAFFGLLYFLYKVVDYRYGSELARRSVLYYSIFPTGFYFSVMYTEAMFVFFVIGSFYFGERKRWLLAGTMGLLAALTRNLGVYLLISFAYLYLREKNFKIREVKADILALGLIPLGLAIYMVYLLYNFGDPFAFVNAQQYWSREFMFPLTGLINSGIKEVAPSLVFLILMVFSFIKLPLHYSIYFAFILLIPMTMGVRWEGDLRLFAMLRYVLPCFPAMIILAEWGRRKLFHYGMIVFSALGLVFFTLLYVEGFFVA